MIKLGILLTVFVTLPITMAFAAVRWKKRETVDRRIIEEYNCITCRQSRYVEGVFVCVNPKSHYYFCTIRPAERGVCEEWEAFK